MDGKANYCSQQRAHLEMKSVCQYMHRKTWCSKIYGDMTEACTSMDHGVQ